MKHKVSKKEISPRPAVIAEEAQQWKGDPSAFHRDARDIWPQGFMGYQQDLEQQELEVVLKCFYSTHKWT